MSRTIRTATVEDAAGILNIYNPCILTTVITFEETPLSVDQMKARMTETMAGYPWLVCAGEDGAILGYAYASRHAVRASYRWSVDVAIYNHPDHQRLGIGRALYRILFAVLRLQGYDNAYAGVALPNPASVGLHESLGFAPAGIFPKAGFKLGQWIDVGWWHLGLVHPDGALAEPVPFERARRTADYARCLEMGECR